ncbi:SusC/RagA family TonB-linked outer membrane protein [Dawidia soli]|uniref:TonB-dependent receptor n=1 Tax=Dawidia soli TaxID=2782352 RepID=A0AAP2DCX2_9BACT|nr:TonB-dependent receptor [Dawidia soli]MBT1689851.1 TonB-dependent receptor [Dawidia soli]
MEKTLRVYSYEIRRNAGGLLLLILLAVLVTPAVAQQEVTIKGKVTELVDGTGLPGVNVLIKGTSTGTTTDMNGEYVLSVPSDATLVFSFVGYFPEEIVVGSQTEINVPMSPDITTLQEMVVVGYGTVKRSDLTGSVVSLKSDDLTPGANMSVGQVLQGRAPGVQVYQKSGEPGSAISVKIRGISSINAGNDPLYVIDGMPVNTVQPVGSPSIVGTAANQNARSPLNGINPADIESIEILKDASATAIYGSRGANGVVLITTKRGSAGALKINYNVQAGTQRVANKLDMLSGPEYRDVLNSIIDAGGGVASERVTGDIADTDWQDALFRSAPIQSHDLSFSGGKDNTKFYASIGYFNQQGVIKNSGTERYTAKINLENSVDKKYAFGMTLNGSYIHDNFNSIGLGINENASALYSAIYYDPTQAVYDANGLPTKSQFLTNIDHPITMTNGQYAAADSYRFFGTIYGEYYILPELSAKVKISGDVNTSRRNMWVDPSTLVGIQYNGIAAVNTGETNYYMTEGTLNYNKQLTDDHSLNAVLGVTYEHFGSNSFSGSGRGYFTPDLTFNAIGTGSAQLNQVGSGRQSAILASYLGRVNYSFKNRYLLTASFRADGSSRFGPNNRFGYFPSLAAAWKIQEESFLSGLNFIDELKLRGSYGTIGNQGIPNYMFLKTYVADGRGPIFNNSIVTQFYPSRIANPDLKWESATQADIGVDFSFFDRRLSGSIEYYNRKTSDLLLDVPQPPSTGFGSKFENVGSMRNTGVDIGLSGDVIRQESFTWNVGGNISTVRNKVLDLGSVVEIVRGGAGNLPAPAIVREGESIGAYYGYGVVGVWQVNDNYEGWSPNIKPGDLKFYDRTSDKLITSDDRVLLGSSLPQYTYGFTSTWTYKNISLAAFFEGAHGGKILNATAVDSYFPVAFRRNKLAEPYLNRWTPENPTNEYPSFVNPASQGQQQINSRTLEDGSYLRLQSVRLSYNLPLAKGPIKNVQFYAVGQNLFTITDYTGMDPAANALGEDVVRVDYASYPMTRTYLLGMNIQF